MNRKAVGAFTLALGLVGAASITGSAQAQYFQSNHATRSIERASGLDSVIVDRYTPFAVPALNDTVKFTYHEPMPDSIMPRSAVVIAKMHFQAEDPDDIMNWLEKYARKNGADWIVSFQEPRAKLTKDRMKVYVSEATLLHVLDAQFINQQDVATLYYENNKLNNYAAVSSYFDTYGRHMGLNDPKPAEPVDQDQNNPDK